MQSEANDKPLPYDAFKVASEHNRPGMIAMPVMHPNTKTIVAQAVSWVLHQRRGIGLETFYYSRTATQLDASKAAA